MSLTGVAHETHEEPAITAIRKTLAAVGCGAVLAASVTACGTMENLSAGQKLDSAFEKMGEQRSVSVELGLDATPAQLTALAGEKPDEALPPSMAEFLTGASVSLSVQSKKPLADSGEKDVTGVQMKIAGPDGTLVEYRMVGDYMYYRMDMEAFGEAMGMPMPSADELGDSLPKGSEKLKAVLDGKWVKIDAKEMAKGPADSSAGDSGAADGPSLDEKTQRKLLKSVKRVIAHDITFKNQGTKNGTERIVATADARDLLTSLFDKLKPVAEELAPGKPLPSAKELKEIPRKKISAAFSIKNGELTAVSIDLAKFGDQPKRKLPLRLAFGEAKGRITAPAGATEVTVGDLMMGSPLMSFAGPDSDSGSFESGALKG